MTNRPKLAEVLGAIAVIGAVVFVFELTLLGVGQLPSGMASQLPTLAGRLAFAVGLAFFCVVVCEGAAARIRNTLAMDSRNIGSPDRNVYGMFAIFNQYADIARSAFWILLMLVVDTGVGFLVSRNRPTLSTELGAYVAFFVVWLIVRKPLLSGLSRLLDSGQPRYEIAPAGDAILITRIAGLRRGRGPVRIGFDEIAEVRVFNPTEASAYREYELGPNVELGIQQTKDLYDMGRGAIARPSVYTIGSESPIGKSVLLRGPNLFFWTHFGGQDGADVLAAFDAYRGRSEHEPAAAPSS